MKRKMYYCNDCGEINESDDIIEGFTVSADSYENDKCGFCGSEDIVEINSDDICPVCGSYHGEDDMIDMRICFEKIYNDSRGQLYIMSHWNMIDYFKTMAELSDEGRNDTIQSVLWEHLSENGEVMKFLRFVCEFDDARSDINRDRRFMGALADSGGIYELIDTNDSVKTAV